AKKFHEFTNDTQLAQHLGDGEHQVGGGRALWQLPGEFKAHDLGYQHGDRLTEHGRFSFNTTNPPTQNAQAVNHGGVRVSTYQGVRLGFEDTIFLIGESTARQIFQIDLVHNASPRRHHLKV